VRSIEGTLRLTAPPTLKNHVSRGLWLGWTCPTRFPAKQRECVTHILTRFGASCWLSAGRAYDQLPRPRLSRSRSSAFFCSSRARSSCFF